jgi:hypothetical protein
MLGPTSFRAYFGHASLSRVSALADVERTCCPFLTIEVGDDAEGVRLEVSSGQADAGPIVEALLDAVTVAMPPPPEGS